MKPLKAKELVIIIGGASLTGTFINALTNAGKFIYSLGQSFGSSLRRIGDNNLCPLK